LPRALVAGGVAVVVGMLSWVLYGVTAGSENTSYHPNAKPPQYVQVTAKHTYWLAVPGGVHELLKAGLRPSAIKCSGAARGEGDADLHVAAVVQQDTDDPKLVNRIASFEAAFTGDLHVTCAGVGAVYVENADDAGFDWSGLFLVLASACLVVGLPLVLSGLRRPAAALPAGTGKHHQVK
jgi:hypothetical protein